LVSIFVFFIQFGPHFRCVQLGPHFCQILAIWSFSVMLFK